MAFNHSAIAWFSSQTVRKLEIIDGAGQRFEAEDAFEKSAVLARDWFRQYLGGRRLL